MLTVNLRCVSGADAVSDAGLSSAMGLPSPGRAVLSTILISVLCTTAIPQRLIEPFVNATKRLRQHVIVGHDLSLQRDTIDPVQPLLYHLDLCGAQRRVRMVDIVLRAVATPARWQLHLHDVEHFVI